MCRCQLKQYFLEVAVFVVVVVVVVVVEVRDCEEKRAQRSCGSECAARRGQDRTGSPSVM